METQEKKQVGERIKSIRLKQGLTQEEFGRKFEASKGNVATWEKGASLPNKNRLKNIAEFGNTTVEELLYGQHYDKFKISNLYFQSKEELKNLVVKKLDAFISIINKTSLTYNKSIMMIANTKIRYFEKLYNRIMLAYEIEYKAEENNIDVNKKLLIDISERIIYEIDSEIKSSGKEAIPFTTPINYLIILINDDIDSYYMLLDYIISVLENIGRQYKSILGFMLNTKISNLSTEINKYFLSDEAKDNLLMQITDINKIYIEPKAIIDTVDFEEYKYIQKSLKSIIAKINKDFRSW